jgi:hypothetical protein
MGCASNVASSFSTGGTAGLVAPAPVPATPGVRVIVDGGLFVGATVGISAAAANAITAIGIGGLLIVGNGYYTPPARMREDRAIHYQDCTKPIENPTANLRCIAPGESAPDAAR